MKEVALHWNWNILFEKPVFFLYMAEFVFRCLVALKLICSMNFDALHAVNRHITALEFYDIIEFETDICFIRVIQLNFLWRFGSSSLFLPEKHMNIGYVNRTLSDAFAFSIHLSMGIDSIRA